MKILVIGLESAAPEILFGDDRLDNIHRLMEMGCYGRLESIIPPIAVPAWMCMSTSQDPGSLGVYGSRNRGDHSYTSLSAANSKSIEELAIWDQVAREGKRSIIVGVPPSYPPRKVNGICISCYLTPDPTNNIYTHPAGVKDEIVGLFGDYPVDVKGFRTENKDWLKEQIFTMSHKQFQVVRHLMQNQEWNYLHFVDIGLDRVHHAFWQFHDSNHNQYLPNNPYKDVIRDYYLHLNEQIGLILELLDDETAVLIVSDHGAQRLDGGFCVNEWLVREGYLVLNEYPNKVYPFDKLNVNWEKTRVWSEGGYYAPIFLNIKGREPRGVLEKSEVVDFRNELKAKLEALPDDHGRPMGTMVYKPEEVYRNVRNIAPDLIVHFGGLYWRSIGGVGYSGLYIHENDTAPEGCNHAQFGAFVLAAPGLPIQGEFSGAHLLDIAPTLLDLGGYAIPSTFQGRSLLAGKEMLETNTMPEDEEAILRERLSGLGYIS